MKLFGKRKTSLTPGASDSPAQPTTPVPKPKQEEQVASYFSAGFKPPSQSQSSDNAKEEKAVDHDIEKLLAMVPSDLNAKQRRVVKRHYERSGQTKEKINVSVSGSSSKKEVKLEDDAKKMDVEVEEEDEDEEEEATAEKEHSQESAKQSEETDETPDSSKETPAVHVPTEETSEQNNNDTNTATATAATSQKGKQSVKEVAEQLKGLNSKDRRKLLRTLGAQYDEAFLEQATEASKTIAKENELKQVKEHEKQKEPEPEAKAKGKRKAEEETETAATADAAGHSKKKKKVKDLRHLPADERERREHQRKMQDEAAARRASGEVLTRHPLNSERRRANKRKPGRAGKIAILRKETREKQQTMREFDAGGYAIRHIKKHDIEYALNHH